MSKFWKIKFKGRVYFICSGNKQEGAIATKFQYEHGLQSYAHLYESGEINRFGREIGDRKDITYLGKEELKPKGDSFPNLISWGIRL
jgi:hypothetical protein